jgi:hypothetical protein
VFKNDFSYYESIKANRCFQQFGFLWLQGEQFMNCTESLQRHGRRCMTKFRNDVLLFMTNANAVRREVRTFLSVKEKRKLNIVVVSKILFTRLRSELLNNLLTYRKRVECIKPTDLFNLTDNRHHRHTTVLTIQYFHLAESDDVSCKFRHSINTFSICIQ